MVNLTLEELNSQDVKRNPSGFYAKLRQQAPLQRFSVMGRDAWLVTDYEDGNDILRDARFTKDLAKGLSSEVERTSTPERKFLSGFAAWRRDMLTTDPPDHTRLRNLVTKAFTPAVIEDLRPRIQQIADQLLDAVQARGSMDLIPEFAFPLPITVISELLGIPVEDRQKFRAWTQAILVLPEDRERGAAFAAAEQAFIQYIQSLIETKREHPGDDLISRLIQAEENGNSLNEKELVSMIWLLIIAGHETTVNLIGDGTLALLEHPDQLRRLQEDPSLIPTAVEELLRFTAPVSMTTGRWASEDISIHDQTIHKGELVFVYLGSANMDPEQFTNPENLDVTRSENKHLAFGKGIHYCLGAPLARLEAQIAFTTLLRRMPRLHLASQPERLVWNSSMILRGLTSLPVEF